MYNGKYVSTEFIIDKIQKDYGFAMSMDKYDIADDIFDAIELIGVPLGYINRVTNGISGNPDPLVVADYSAELPCDLRMIQGVRVYETKAPLIEDVGTFKPGKGTSNEQYEGKSQHLMYHVNDNFIFVNFEEGKLEMSYLAFPTDSTGVPLIPDNTRYINGVIAYTAERIGHRMFWAGNLDERKYERLVSERAFWMPSAATALNMPSYDKAESMKNQLSNQVIKSKKFSLFITANDESL